MSSTWFGRLGDGELNGVRLRVDATGLQMCVLEERKWWQLWKPKTITTVLADAECHVESGDRVAIRRVGAGYAALVNEVAVLAWTPHT